ncbi:MAG: hypothetical protein JWO69_1661 [Thermoleophilia bacterium]|nr:hypothetical protein [Thermoleophilia bacterium]
MRRLNEPAPVRVHLGPDGRPDRILWRGRDERVETVLDTWVVDDAWWTDRPVRRLYHEVQLTTGVRLVLSWDLVAREWLAQR